MTRRVAFMAGIGIVAALALGAGSLIYTVTRPTPPTTAQIAALTAHVKTLEAGLAQANANLASANALNDTTKLTSEVGEMSSCLPEMEGQISGASVTGSYISDPSIIAGQTTQLAEYPQTLNLGPQLSQDCNQLLYPTR